MDLSGDQIIAPIDARQTETFAMVICIQTNELAIARASNYQRSEPFCERVLLLAGDSKGANIPVAVHTVPVSRISDRRRSQNLADNAQQIGVGKN